MVLWKKLTNIEYDSFSDHAFLFLCVSMHLEVDLPTQEEILLGSRPPKLLQKHDKAWTDSTSPTCTQLIYSLQSHFSKHLSSRSTAPKPSVISSLVSLPSDDTQCQVCQSPFDEERMLLCDICNAGWHMGCLLC